MPQYETEFGVSCTIYELMCLILFAWKHSPDFDLVLAANRDEFYARPAAQAEFWTDVPDMLAGRDLQGGGAWLGVSKDGRFAAVTNFREPHGDRPDVLSRGSLVVNYIKGKWTPADYAAEVAARGDDFNGFNLLVGDQRSLLHCSNRGPGPIEVPPGIHGLSNHLLDTSWPKVTRGREALQQSLRDEGTADAEAILRILTDRHAPSDDELPDTGVGLETERMLAPIFIESEDYGTRCSTVRTINRKGRVRFSELSHRCFEGEAFREFVFRPGVIR